MPRAAPPMPADSGDQVSRRTVLTGLIALFLAGCERLGFLAANAPAAFGSYTRHTNIAYGPDPQQRLDVYVPESAVGRAAGVGARATKQTIGSSARRSRSQATSPWWRIIATTPKSKCQDSCRTRRRLRSGPRRMPMSMAAQSVYT